MKLADYLLFRLSGIMLLVIGIWSIVYFLVQMYEIHDGIDEGLTNLKQEFILQANTDSGFIENMEKHNPLNIKIAKTNFDAIKNMEERTYTSKIYFKTEEEEEEVRLLETAFRCELNGEYYILQIFTSNVESNDLTKNILYSLIALYIALAIVIAITGKKVIHKATNPLYDLLDKLEHFQLGNTEMIDFPKSHTQEFNTLNVSIKKLLENNIETFNEQKNFIENATHELQTPIAIIIGKLELLMNDPQIKPGQLKEIGAALNILNKMKRLNSSLLLLSKIKNKQFAQSQQVDLSEVFTQIFEDFRELTEHRQLTLSVHKKGSPLVDMNLDLAIIMASNLVKNAISHNITGGTICVDFSPTQIIIANDGDGLTQDTMDIFFERYKTQSDQWQSLGLGLSLVKSITELYDIKINYKFDKQHIITLDLKS